MKADKKKWLDTIFGILKEEKIHDQEQLRSRLIEKGWNVTQATLSRTLKQINAYKVPDGESGYVYKPAESSYQGTVAISNKKLASDAILKIDFSGVIGVIKTFPGSASSIAIIIDRFNGDEIIGTVAGDDTVLVISNEKTTRVDFINVIKRIFPAIGPI